MGASSSRSESPQIRGPARPSLTPTRAGAVIRGRYRVLETIGKGGMAVVYRARDLKNQRDVALKQLVYPAEAPHYSTSASLFEREFRTLAQLSHPRIIEVYEFGIDECGPFYTMELLDGGDLLERAPLDWHEACRIAYLISSSLALLHSRRLVHRDVTPSNVRCTRDGQAKLIDFGAMVPMGAGSIAVGTPQFMAPEVALRSNLDARADLFSLGATLYFALTRCPPYPGKDFNDVVLAWRTAPVAPSQYVAGIPEALDSLVLSLIGVDPATRPRTAFEVMQRLAALLGLRDAEPPQVSRAYLSTPSMLGRDAVMARIASEMKRAFAGSGRSVLVEGAAGLGRSRVLDASALLADTLGGRVLRASGSALAGGAFRTATRLAEHLLEDAPDLALAAAHAEGLAELIFEDAVSPADEVDDGSRGPKLRDFRTSSAGRYALQSALRCWLLRVSAEQPLVIAVDDLQRLDEPSAALLAALAAEIEERRLFVIATTESDAEPSDRLAFDVLARHSTRLTLTPLSRADSARLFESIFGDVPNVGIVSDGIHAIVGGNPRDAMELAQHLCDQGRLRYERGTWTLPSRLDPSDLPRDAQAAIQARIAGLTPLARWLAETQALATYKVFTREDYATLRSDADAEQVDAAISELVSRQIVTSDGHGYSLKHRGWNTALVQPLTNEEQAERHRALVGLYEGKLRMGVVQHALLAGLEQRALDELSPILPGLPEATNLYELTDLSALELAATFERALDAAERIGRGALELNHLRRWLAALSVVSDDKFYFRVAPAWLERLKRDSGYTLWEQYSDIADRGQRLSRAMQDAYARWAATPEAERVYKPDEAIKGLAHYVGISMAIGNSRLELSINEALPALLEPFAPISPLIDVIWQNATAARQSSCRLQWEKAHARWVQVYERLSQLGDADPQFVGVFQRAVAYAIGANEATMGLATATRWADLLDVDPLQRVNGLYIRRIIRLQQGDHEGAERCRKQAEVLTLQARARQMFASLHWVELMVCGIARDLTGVKQCAERIRVLATRSAGWIPFLRLAEGLSALCCDDLEGARTTFEETIALSEPSAERLGVPAAWCAAVAGLLEALVGLGKHVEAATSGRAALAVCGELGIEAGAHGISRALALAEAKQGDGEQAAGRVDAILRQQMELGVTGLQLAATHESRARVALLCDDRDTFDQYAFLAAREYGRGHGSALGARFERLMQEDRNATRGAALAAAARRVSEVLKAAGSAEERAERVLEMLCQTTAAPSGYLYFLDDERAHRMASRSEIADPEGLDEFVRTHSERLLDDEGSTAFMDDEVAEREAQGTFVDGRGVPYRTCVLPGSANGEFRYVAIALLALGEQKKVLDPELKLAIGSYLLEVRDTTGART